MTVRYEWLVQNSVYHFVLEGNVTVADLETINDQFILNARQIAPDKLCSIVDCLQVSRFPLNVKLVTSQKTSAYNREPNIGWIIIITTNPVIRIMADAALKLARARFKVARTQAEAVEILRQKNIIMPLNSDSTSV